VKKELFEVNKTKYTAKRIVAAVRRKEGGRATKGSAFVTQ
jgi:hypothetical protein